MKARHYDFKLLENLRLEGEPRIHTLKCTYKGLLFKRVQYIQFTNLSNPQVKVIDQTINAIQDFTVIKKHLKRSK